MSGLAQPADVLAPEPRRLSRRPQLIVILCLCALAVVVLCALTGTLFAPHDPAAQDLALGVQGPGGGHLLGTDASGRDVLSRLIAGTRTAVLGPLVVVLGSAALGSLFGLAAGYRGGWVDSLTMRTVDLAYALPGLLLAIVILGVLGGGYPVAILVLLVLTVPYDTRIIRGAALHQRTLPYVDAARTLGLSPRRIMWRHIWPNLLPLLVANGFLNFAFTLVALSGLSFLGLGAGPASPDWGRSINDNLTLLQANPLATLAPAAAVVVTATAMNIVGDWAYERLSDRGSAR
jgi:peptide/nickel transport system permease protein